MWPRYRLFVGYQGLCPIQVETCQQRMLCAGRDKLANYLTECLGWKVPGLTIVSWKFFLKRARLPQVVSGVREGVTAVRALLPFAAVTQGEPIGGRCLQPWQQGCAQGIGQSRKVWGRPVLSLGTCQVELLTLGPGLSRSAS